MVIFPEHEYGGRVLCVKQFMWEVETLIPCLKFSDYVLGRDEYLKYRHTLCCLTGSVTSLREVPPSAKEA